MDSGSENHSDFFGVQPSVEDLAVQQGVQPARSLDDLAGEFWPETDSVDEFIATVRRWRRESA
jgi:hypothetical protein